jgi:hypothetical protein
VREDLAQPGVADGAINAAMNTRRDLDERLRPPD